MPNDEDAAAPGDGLSALANRGPLGSLAAAFEEGRQAAQQQRLMRKADIGTAPSVAAPLKSIASRMHKKQAAAAEVSPARSRGSEGSGVLGKGSSAGSSCSKGMCVCFFATLVSFYCG